MISDLLDTGADSIPPRARRAVRLTMKPDRANRGRVDGGWWPWSSDPYAEFPVLIMALTAWIGSARHVAYHPGAWAGVGRVLMVEGRAVCLAGSRTVQADTVVLTGPNLDRIRVLVIPPATRGGVARAVLRSASGPGTNASAEDILASNGVSRGGQSNAACGG